MLTYEQLEAAAEGLGIGGGDIGALLQRLNSQLNPGKTSLGLNHWKLSDKPVMEDFNEDNRIIDEKLCELMEGKAEKAYVDSQLANKADKTLPTIHYDLSIDTNGTSNSTYWKNQFGEVTVNIANSYSPPISTYSNPDFPFGKVIYIGLLPAGFTPAQMSVDAVMFIHSQTRGDGIAHVFVDSGGGIFGVPKGALYEATDIDYVVGKIHFVAQ
jgi:hypothetical protein